MIEGTKSYRRKGEEAPAPTTNEATSAPAVDAAAAPAKPLEEITPAEFAPPAEEYSEPETVNLERRAWFASLVPAFGDGLVKLIRASNNLQRDLNEAIKAGSDSLIEHERKKNDPS